MSLDLEFARLLAETALIGFGGGAPDWLVEEVGYYDLDARENTSKWSEAISIVLVSPSGEYEEASVFFVPSDLSLAWSVVNTVDAIQDHAVEVTDGEPLPPCPGHRHPLVARVIEGVPKWVCMTEGVAHYARDILPGFDPAFETPEEYLVLRDRRA